MVEFVSDNRTLTLFQRLILLVIPVVAWNFYNYVGFDQRVTKLIGFIVSLILLIVFVISIRFYYQRGTYSRYLSLYLFVVLFSFLNAQIFWGQSPVLTFRASSGVFFIIYYYILRGINPSFKDISKVIVFFAILYALLWLIAFLAAPSVLFGNLESLDDKRGMFRVLQLRGFDFIPLLFFYSLVNRTNNPLYTIAAVFCFLMTVFTLSRMYIGAMILIAGAFLLRKRRALLIVFIAIVLLVPSKYTFDSDIAKGLLDLTESQFNEEEGINGLIRSEYRTFGKLYDFHLLTFLFGNGLAHIDSSYGKYEDLNKEQYAFNRTDAGYVGQYVSFGICGIICLLLILRLCIFQKIPDDYLYLKLFIFYLYIVSITSNSFSEFTITLAIVLFELDELKLNNGDMELAL